MGTGQRGGEGSQLSILPLGLRWLPLLLVRALLVRGMEQLGGRLGFRRLPMAPTAGQPSPSLHQWGQKELGASVGPGVCVRTALSPRCSDEPPHTEADKGAALLGLPDPGPSRRRSSARSGQTLPLLWQGQKGASVHCVWAHNGLCPGRSVSISVSSYLSAPIPAGSQVSSSRERAIFVPTLRT